jgi:outer membrane immunogenic protein
MKRLTGSAAVCLLPVITQAADIPVRTPAPAPITVAAPAWTGFYFGGHLGYGWGSPDTTGLRNNSPSDLDTKGVVAGLHAGYNHQSGMWVFGLEGDLSAAPWKESSSIGGGSDEFRTRSTGSVRGRLGAVFNDVLFYGTAGVGVVDRGFRSAVSGNVVADKDYYKVGAVAGGGVEFKFSPNIILGVEGLYYFVKQNKVAGIQNDLSVSGPPNLLGARAGDVGVVRTRLTFQW